ncbi:tetratricopeptide repeat protein 28-like [Porites lutea]
MFPLVACSSSQEDRVAALRPFELDEDDQEQEPSPTLELLYKIFITPVADLLDEPEILIVPDRSLYKIPFAALKDENGKYLSETFRIRIVPSLTTLKLIQERPATQCNDRSVLIVGDPDVSYVSEFSQLSFARKEAKMIAEWLGVQPLLGCQATKQAVLESMHSASLIHFAAHGDAERGEIVLAPVQPVNRPLHKDDYVLTTADVSEVKLTAKLVVLSCCHSALGHIRAEGVVGIARAFLGSGARSVLVALWAIEDEATEQFMGRFYEHLVRGESATESLHQAMKWMRENGFPEVRKWAPFMLIGDNVTFDFRK